MRRSYASREVLKVGKMVDGHPYFAKSSVKESFAIAAFDGAEGLEERVLKALKCKPGQKVVCFMQFIMEK